jgi:hypothetical protein
MNWRHHFLNFLAVILGVYLAFYINEKARISQEKKDSAQFIESLIADLTADIKTYESYQIPANKLQQEKIGKFLEKLVANNLDSFGVQVMEVFQVENFSPTSSTYASIKAAGKLKLINNLAIQKKLSDYYEGTVIESIKKGEFQVDFFTDELLSWMVQNVNLVNMELLKKDELILLQNKLIVYESLIEQKIANYEMLVEESKTLQTNLEKLLKD